MEIVEDKQFRVELLKKIRAREFSERTGIHMSDLNFCLNKQVLRKLQPKEDTDQETLIYSIGWATQRWLTGQDEDEPSKIVDGITVTCDALVPVEGVILDPGHFNSAPWELKATYQSSNRPIIENTHWLRQIMCQCKVMGVTEAYLSRFELMGNWKMRAPKDATEEEKKNYVFERPTLHAYRLTFTQDEIDKNWAWFLERKKAYEEMMETGELLPKVTALPPGQAWECDYCNYKEECSSE